MIHINVVCPMKPDVLRNSSQHMMLNYGFHIAYFPQTFSAYKVDEFVVTYTPTINKYKFLHSWVKNPALNDQIKLHVVLIL